MASSTATTVVSPNVNQIVDAINRIQTNINQVITPAIKALQNTPVMGAKPPAGIRPSLAGTFTELNSKIPDVYYYKDALGYVHIRGTVTTTGGSAAGASIFNMGLAYAPAGIRRFAVECVSGGVLVLQSIRIDTNSLVKATNAIAAGGTISLDCSYLAGG